jgi:hypothetical protein
VLGARHHEEVRVAQVSAAFVLLIGAGLLLASFRQALTIDPGFAPDGVLTASVSLPDARYDDGAARRRFTGPGWKKRRNNQNAIQIPIKKPKHFILAAQPDWRRICLNVCSVSVGIRSFKNI